MKEGTLFGVGVGPGDPELLTLKAVRILKYADIIAAPDSGGGEKTALSIVSEFIKGKELLFCPTPMSNKREEANSAYDSATSAISALLASGKNVAFITLGDPSVYSTYLYIEKRVRISGFKTETIPGIPSFCAAAAKLGIGLCEGSEPLTVIPASSAETSVTLDAYLKRPGTKVFMKAGKTLPALTAKLRELPIPANDVYLAANCGMENELLAVGETALNAQTGYFSLVIVTDRSSYQARLSSN